MRKLLLSCLLVAGVSSAWAYDYPYLTLQNVDGTEHVVSVESLTITFADGQLVVQNADGTVTLGLEALSKMFFTTVSDGIAEVSADGGRADVYSADGVCVGTFASAEQARRCLKSGMYVIKTDGRTIKAVVR